MGEMLLTSGISVVLCCYNSSGVIVPTMVSLRRQKVPPGCGYEVILVDNNCHDDTVSLAERAWGASAPPLHIIRELRPGLIYARKAGVLQAKYSILLFVDDDNMLEPDWIIRLMEMYQRRPEIGGAGGYNIPLLEEGVQRPVWFDKYSGAYGCTPPHKRPEVSAYKTALVGAGLSLRTNLARLIFDSSLPFFLIGRTQDTLNRGDDSEICFRAGLMGWKLWYEKKLRLQHVILGRRLNWEYVLRARRGFGRADVILKIYRDLLAGNEPLTRKQLSVYISSLWEAFWQRRSRHRDMIKLRNEGDDVALRYQYLQGLTESYLEIYQEKYEDVREKIIEFYRK